MSDEDELELEESLERQAEIRRPLREVSNKLDFDFMSSEKNRRFSTIQPFQSSTKFGKVMENLFNYTS